MTEVNAREMYLTAEDVVWLSAQAVIARKKALSLESLKLFRALYAMHDRRLNDSY